VAVLAPGEADEVEALGQRPVVREVVERGQQLAVGQVARGPEDDQGRRVDGLTLEALDERVRGLLDRAHDSRRTAWPPNWLRSAASTLAV
jgi:hypothetical protein